MLAVAETSEQRVDKLCDRDGAKRCFFGHSDQLLLAVCTGKDKAVYSISDRLSMFFDYAMKSQSLSIGLPENRGSDFGKPSRIIRQN